MLKLFAYGEEYECDKVVKDSDSLFLYKDGSVFCKFSGISDFGGYTLEDEEGNIVEFEVPAPPQPTPEQQRLDEVEAVLAKLVYGGDAV